MEKKTVNVVYAAVIIGLLLFFVWRYMPFESEVHPENLVFSVEGGPKQGIPVNGDKPLLLHFYASWCGPCMAEFPEMVKAYPNLKDKYQLLVLTDDSHETIRQVKDRFNPPFEIHKLEGSIKDAGVYSIPATVETDPKGKVLKLQSGRWHWESY